MDEELNIRAAIEKIIDQMITLEDDGSSKDCKYDIVSMNQWEWPQGVALFAMYQYYSMTGKTEMLAYLIDWFDSHLKKGLPDINVNTTCPMLTLTYLYEETENEEYLPYLDQWCDDVMSRMPRTVEQGFQHVTSDFLNDGQLWDDTLYMTVLFIARMGVLKKDDKLKEESIRQFLVHLKYLTDTETGLFFHGWDFNGCHNFANALWGRGNSWYTAGLVDYLAMIDLQEGVRDYLISTLERQVQTLGELQDESGLWHTILNDKETYLETSASSGFAYGVLKAVREGLLPQKYEKIGLKAVGGVLQQIDEKGVVHGVSWGTPVFYSLEEYNQVGCRPMPYGQSMALLMLTESLKHTSL